MVFVSQAFSCGPAEETILYNIISLSQQTNRRGKKDEKTANYLQDA